MGGRPRAIGTLQKTRALRLDTKLPGEDTLLINRFSGGADLGALPVRASELMARWNKNAASVQPDAVVGTPVVVSLDLPDKGEVRYFHGIVSRFVEGTIDKRFHHYHAEVVPWLYLLTLKAGCRVFQDMTILEIIKKGFDELKADFPDVVAYRPPSLALTEGKYPKIDFCVFQYRETAFNFVSRLMEEKGIFYFFEHTQTGHTLVLSDVNSACQPWPGRPKEIYSPAGGVRDEKGTVVSFQKLHMIGPGAYTLQGDHHFEKLTDQLTVPETSLNLVANNAKLELYDYPGEYAKLFSKTGRNGEVLPEGDKLVKTRMRQEETFQKLIWGSSTCARFTPANQFQLEHFPAPGDLDGPFVLTGVQHLILQNPDYHSDEPATSEPYSNTFTCIPLSVSYVTPRVTPIPVVGGPQTAIVVGTQGFDIDTDKYGRVKVVFHWDREHTPDDADSSCWDPRRHPLGRQAVGHDPHSPDRPGGDRHLSRRRPRPAAHHGHGLQP